MGSFLSSCHDDILTEDFTVVAARVRKMSSAKARQKQPLESRKTYARVPSDSSAYLVSRRGEEKGCSEIRQWLQV